MSERCGEETKTTDAPCRHTAGKCPVHGGGASPGRPRIELTDNQLEMLENLASIGLSQEEAAYCLPMSERTLSDRLREGDNEVSAVYRRAREEYHRELTNRERLIAMGKAGQLGVEEVPLSEQRKTIKWIRKSRFGATEKQTLEHTGEDGGPIEIREVTVRVPEDDGDEPD